MGKSRLKIAVLTSSRADYGIYLPLLRALRDDARHQTEIIAFGTHLSVGHGHTVDAIVRDGFEVNYRLETAPEGDRAEDISLSMARTGEVFAHFWATHEKTFDLIICLGDRYEMFAAVAAAAPYNLLFAHLHGGEITLGAIDNAFRNCITHFSQIHFASTESHALRVRELTNGEGTVVNTGALSLDNLREMQLMSRAELQQKFGVDIDEQTILCTFHPETVNTEMNASYAKEIVAAFQALQEMRVVITLPNADTMGNTVRSIFTSAFADDPRVSLVENFGSLGYFSAMNACGLMLGNTSSGIIEAASMGKYVINVGDRQKGRSAGKNVIHCAIRKEAMLEAVAKIKTLPALDKSNMYDQGGAARKIISTLETVLC